MSFVAPKTRRWGVFCAMLQKPPHELAEESDVVPAQLRLCSCIFLLISISSFYGSGDVFRA